MKLFRLILKNFFFLSLFSYCQKEIIEINLFKIDILKEIQCFSSFKENEKFLYSNLVSLKQNKYIDYIEITEYVENGKKWVYNNMRNITDTMAKEEIYFER